MSECLPWTLDPRPWRRAWMVATGRAVPDAALPVIRRHVRTLAGRLDVAERLYRSGRISREQVVRLLDGESAA